MTADPLPRLRALREASWLAWEMASDTCYIDTERQTECQAAADSAMASWDAAIEAAEEGRFAAAIVEMRDAETLASDWGDSSHEREAIAALVAQRDDIAGGAR